MGGTGCTAHAVVRTYLRDGQSPQKIMNKGYFMVNSTYLVASDPNSMRNAGDIRNAQYVITDPVDKEYLKDKAAKPAKEAMQEE
jgi:hypothetical protein